MDIVKYRRFVVAAFCVLMLWLTLLYTTNYYYSTTSTNIQLLQYHIVESKFTNELHKDTLANLDNFEFVMNNASLCMKSTTTEIHSSVIVIMIHTARNNFDRRYAIRSTWGSIKLFKQWRLHLIFLLGTDPSSDPESYVDSRLSDESREFGDIVMGNFVDSYNNLTYKHLMGYKWVSTFCPTAKYILKTDDDIYADIFQIIEILLVELMNSRKTYACENMGGNTPIREKNSKWYVSEKIFAEETYPDYCSGSAYLMKADDASKIYSISNRTNFLWIDDVFVTGVLREKYDVIVNNRSSSSLQILTVYNRHHLGDKNEIIDWCSKDLNTNQLKYTFILLDENEFTRNMFCIWNKVRLMRYAMDIVLDQSIALSFDRKTDD